jgi:hypothetical protein
VDNSSYGFLKEMRMMNVRFGSELNSRGCEYELACVQVSIARLLELICGMSYTH